MKPFRVKLRWLSRHPVRVALYISWAGTVILLVRTFLVNDHLLWSGHGFASTSIATYPAHLDFMKAASRADVPLVWSKTDTSQPHPDWLDSATSRVGAFGIYYYQGADIQFPYIQWLGQPKIPYQGIVVNLWTVFTVTSVFVAVSVFRLARRSRRPGICPVCSYDLRATPDRCPECGTQIHEP